VRRLRNEGGERKERQEMIMEMAQLSAESSGKRGERSGGTQGERAIEQDRGVGFHPLVKTIVGNVLPRQLTSPPH
jgi:hypothetical protein